MLVIGLIIIWTYLICVVAIPLLMTLGAFLLDKIDIIFCSLKKDLKVIFK